MFVYLQVARAFKVQCEAAVLCDLLEHVIEKSQSRGDAAGTFARQIDLDRDVGLLGLAVSAGAARLSHDAGGDGRPGFARLAFQPDSQTLDAEIRGELQIRVPVADREAALLVDFIRGQKPLDHAQLRLAAGAVFALEVGTDADRLELDSLRTEQVQNEAVRKLEGFARKVRRSQSVLIGDHYKGEAGAPQFQQRRHDAGHETNFRQTVHLFIGHFLVQRAVAIQEKYASAAHGRPTQRNSASFSVRVPTETRRARGRAGCARKSRTISPPPMLLAMNLSASRQSIIKKLASLGQT